MPESPRPKESFEEFAARIGVENPKESLPTLLNYVLAAIGDLRRRVEALEEKKSE